jgi:hypothetical protein
MKYKIKLLVQPNVPVVEIVVNADSFEHSGNLLFFNRGSEVALIVNANMLVLVSPEQ